VVAVAGGHAGSHNDETPAAAGNSRRSRLYRLSLFRPVTPEVAGSSPVAPALKDLLAVQLCTLVGRAAAGLRPKSPYWA
jgi:hypothetical protein